MITQGLSQHELNLITKILDEHKVRYAVGTAGGTEVKVKGGRGDASFYAIEVSDEDFEKLLPANAKMKLADLGIYPEMEAPDFSEPEVKEDAKLKKDPEVVKQNMKKIEYIFIAVLVLGLVMFIRKVINEQ